MIWRRSNPVSYFARVAFDDEAKRPESPIRLQQPVLDPAQLAQKTVTVVSTSTVAEKLGLAGPAHAPGESPASTPPLFATEADRRVAQVAVDVIRSFESKTDVAPTVAALQTPTVQAQVVAEAERRLGPQQLEFFTDTDGVSDVVAKTTAQVVLGTIDIPRIVVLSKDDVRSGFKPFKPDLTALRYPVPSDELVAQTLRTGEQERISLGRGGIEEHRLEDYVGGGLVDFDDVSYDDHAELLYDLAKFQSDTERMLAIIPERNASRWFRPAKGQFQIYYKVGHDQQDYQPDFVAETDAVILMLEAKKVSEMDDAVVRAKRDAGVAWCGHASDYAGKPWRYVPIPLDAVAENMTLDGLVKLYG